MIIEAALKYARAGKPIFPCTPEKTPYIKGGFKNATTDEEVIRGWYQQWPDALIGMPTGEASGIAVLDLDVKKGKNGLEAVPDWEARSSVIAKTKSGGVHLYFRADGAPRCTSDDIALGVDTRGDGGYVIVPPSTGYTWLNGSDLSALPPWPNDLRPKSKPKREKRQDRTIPTEVQDSTLLAAAIEALPNADLGWDEWNKIGMALWRATEGSEAGRALFHVYSRKSAKKYDVSETDDRWDHFASSPPNEIGAGTLFFLADEAKPSWRKAYLKRHFSCDKSGTPHARSQRNIVTALSLLGVSLRHDVFSDRETISGLKGYELLDDAALERLWLLVEERFRFLPPKDFFWIVVSDLARRNSHHPVRDYLASLKWDGIPRLEEWLVTYGGAKDSKYVRAVGAIALIAAVRRVRQPGCKFDEMLILESKQGTEKSKALETLSVNDEWFSDDLPLGSDGKRVIEQTRGRWIVEAAELSGMRKADIEHLKSMLSRSTDSARLSYARKRTEKRREFIIVGTTNDKAYLKDVTGNRRFWPVEIEKFDIRKLKSDRDQLWAEAAEREANGESIRLDPQLWASAADEQKARTVEEPWIDIVARLLGDREGKLLAADAWTLVGLTAGQQTQEHNKRLGSAMRELGWERDKQRFGGPPENCYTKGNEPLKRIIVARTPEGTVWVGYDGDKQTF